MGFAKEGMKRPVPFPGPWMTCLACGLLLGTGGVLPGEESFREADASAEAALHEAEERASRMLLFEAIAEGDQPAMEDLLAGGLDPNSCLPTPVEPEFVKQFPDERLRYYLAKEQGFTALMMATALGRLEMVRSLLLAGADPHRMTKKHRTFALWLAGKYGNIEIMRCLMGIGPEHEAMAYRIEIDLGAQKAWLWHEGRIALFAPISSGRKSHPTPTGRYLVTNKYRMWKSTLYDARMPYFLRLSCGDFGLHQGILPGRPASHGCIRLPGKEAKELFAAVPVGTLVEIK
jgi:hypothetical protein